MTQSNRSYKTLVKSIEWMIIFCWWQVPKILYLHNRFATADGLGLGLSLGGTRGGGRLLVCFRRGYALLVCTRKSTTIAPNRNWNKRVFVEALQFYIYCPYSPTLFNRFNLTSICCWLLSCLRKILFAVLYTKVDHIN